MAGKEPTTGVVSDQDFETRSAALMNGEKIVGPAKAATEVPSAKGKGKTNGKTTEPKPKKNLTVHKHWLIDIRRFAKTLGIEEGQELVGKVRRRSGKKVLELEFLV